MSRWMLVGILVASMATAAVIAWRRYTSSQALAEAGKALFDGATPLTARMAGHDSALPAQAVRCANCHARQARVPDARPAPATTAGPPTDTYAAPLSRAALLEMRARRGGPPSRYDARSFCRALREGVDPANVMVVQTMPRYWLSDQECSALWAYAIAE